MRIRTLRPDEVDLHREFRLCALRDAPNAFGKTIEEEKNQPAAYWEYQTKAVTGSAQNVLFVACQGSQVFGMIYGLRDGDSRDGARIGGMWVAPAMRNQGIGRQMVTAVMDWARERGLQHIGLWAPLHSAQAMAFYRRMGFRETENRNQLRANSAVEIVEMTRQL